MDTDDRIKTTSCWSKGWSYYRLTSLYLNYKTVITLSTILLTKIIYGKTQVVFDSRLYYIEY